jgi:hypothetical protein
VAPKISIIGIDNRSNLKYMKRLSIIFLSNIAQPYFHVTATKTTECQNIVLVFQYIRWPGDTVEYVLTVTVAMEHILKRL